MKTFTDEQRHKIINALKDADGNTAKVAHRLRIHESHIQAIDMEENGTWNYTKEGTGREEMKQFIIATRKVNDPAGWNNEDPKIADARKRYDDGEIELVTGRDGMNLIMYAVPRKEKAVRVKPYFTMLPDLNNVIELKA